MKKFHLTLHKKLSKSETLNNNFENLKTTSFGRWFFYTNVWYNGIEYNKKGAFKYGKEGSEDRPLGCKAA